MSIYGNPVMLGGSGGGGGTERNLFLPSRYTKVTDWIAHQNISITDAGDSGIIINGSFTPGVANNQLYRWELTLGEMVVFSNLYAKVECSDPRVYATVQKNGGDWAVPVNINGNSGIFTMPAYDWEDGYVVGYSLHPDSNAAFNNVSALIKFFAD